MRQISIFRLIVNMAYSFQDKENLYLVMDMMSGGDLRFHLSRKKRFSETETSILHHLLIFRIFGCMHYWEFRIRSQQLYTS